MFCTNCGKESPAKEKFCIKCGEPIRHGEENKNISNEVKKNTNFFKLLFRFVYERKDKIKNRLKNIILFLCLYFLSLTILDAARGSYYSDDNAFVALAPTILIIYAWNKIAKKFRL